MWKKPVDLRPTTFLRPACYASTRFFQRSKTFCGMTVTNSEYMESCTVRNNERSSISKPIIHQHHFLKGIIMKKQNVLKTLAMVAFTVMALGLVACSEMGSNPADPMAMINNVQTTFDLNGQPLDFSDATLETPMAVKERPESGKDQKGPKSPFERLLAALNLTPDQKALVERLQAAHKDCATAALEALRAAERSILRRANARSEEIKALAKAGTITREEARTQLRDLNKATREAIKSLPEREAARTALKDCDDAFLARLGRILDEKQKAILDDFIKARDARNGGGPRGGGDTGGGPRGGGDTTGGRGPTGGGDTVRPGGRG
jgi:hypothetical protein